MAELLRGTDYRKYSPGMLEPRDRDQRLASTSNLKKLLQLLPSVEDASVVGEGCSGVPTRSGSTSGQDHSNPGSRRIASSLRTPGRIVGEAFIPIDCGLFLFELAPAPFALYVPRSSGAGELGDAPADSRVESGGRTG